MTRAIVLVWLGTASARAAHEPDIEAWAEARQVRLDDPSRDTPLPTASHDEETATKIESLLAEAQTAAFGPDPGAASAALDLAGEILDAHPELAEAPFLLAEALRTRARLLQQSAPAEAVRIRAAADALDGPLAAPFGGPATTESAPPAPGVPAVRISGLLPHDDVYVDGRPGDSVPLGEARHHVRVLRDGRLAFARWITASTGGALDVTLPQVSPCSEADLADARFVNDRLDAASGVECPGWIAMRPAADRVEVARCEGARCGTFLPWSRTWGKRVEGPAQPAWPRKHGGAFVPWLLGGIVAAAGTSVLLWQSGAFDKEGPPRRSMDFVPPERPSR